MLTPAPPRHIGHFQFAGRHQFIGGGMEEFLVRDLAARPRDRSHTNKVALALRAAKAALDPHGILNPGVLVDPVRKHPL